MKRPGLFAAKPDPVGIELAGGALRYGWQGVAGRGEGRWRAGRKGQVGRGESGIVRGGRGLKMRRIKA